MKWLLIAIWLAAPAEGVEPTPTPLAAFPSQKSCMGAIGALKAQGFKLPLLCVEDVTDKVAERVPL